MTIPEPLFLTCLHLKKPIGCKHSQIIPSPTDQRSFQHCNRRLTKSTHVLNPSAGYITVPRMTMFLLLLIEIFARPRWSFLEATSLETTTSFPTASEHCKAATQSCRQLRRKVDCHTDYCTQPTLPSDTEAGFRALDSYHPYSFPLRGKINIPGMMCPFDSWEEADDRPMTGTASTNVDLRLPTIRRPTNRSQRTAPDDSMENKACRRPSSIGEEDDPRRSVFFQ